MKYGPETLSITELLAIIFGRGVKGESVIDVSQKLISRFSSLEILSQISLKHQLIILKKLRIKILSRKRSF